MALRTKDAPPSLRQAHSKSDHTHFPSGTVTSGSRDGGEAFDLLKMVDVVAGHGFDDSPEGHSAAFGVGGAAAPVFVRDGIEIEEIPVAGGLEEGEGRAELVGCVPDSPSVLIKGLDDGVRLVERGSESLTEAKRENNLAIGEVGGDVRDAPFARGGGGTDLRGGEAGGEGADALGCGSENGNRILAVEELGVRI